MALGDTPETAPALIKLANLALSRKDTVQAESLIDRALNVAPNGPIASRALLVKGNIALANGLPGVAELQYLQALAQDQPNAPEAALSMETYAEFLATQSRTDEGRAMKFRAQPIREARVTAMSPHLTAVGNDPVFRVGGGVTAPILLAKKEPEYSDEARAAKCQGLVMLYVVIGTDGQAYNIKLMKSLGFGLDEQAVDAVMQWKFQPGTRGGLPVAVEATIEVNFRLL